MVRLRLKGMVLCTLSLVFACSAWAQLPDTLQVKSSYGGAWQKKPLQLMATLQGFVPMENPRANWTEEGSYTCLRSDSTGYYRVEKIDGRWWMIDPNGYATINRGMCCMPTSDIQHNYDMCYDLGFNGSGNFLSSESQTMKIYNTQNLRQWGYTRRVPFYAGYAKARHKYYPDTPEALRNNDTYIFALDPLFARYCDSIAALRIAPYAEERQMVGWFTDNEIAFQNNQLQLLVRDLPEGDTCRTLALEWAAAHGLTEHDCVKATTALTEDLKNQFVAYVAETYYKTVYEAIRTYDPNHLILGSRLHGRPRANLHLVAASHKYTDVTSVNFYDRYQPDDQIAKTEWTQDHPCIIGEFYIKDINRQSGTQSGAGWYVNSQQERGYWYQHVVLQLLKNKCFVGWHYFRYADDPDGSNKGITDANNTEYKEMTKWMKEINDQVYPLTEYFDSISRDTVGETFTQSIPAAADTYIEVGSADTHGGESTMLVHYTRAEANRKEAFVRFSLAPNLIMSDLRRAELELTVTAGEGIPLLMISAVEDNQWQENTLNGTLRTANDAWKSVYGRIASVYDSIRAVTYRFDVTPFVRAYKGSEISFKIHALVATADAVSIASKENTNTAMHPQLHLVLQGSNTATLIDPLVDTGYSKAVSITGQYVGENIDNLSSGIYIINHKKVLIP